MTLIHIAETLVVNKKPYVTYGCDSSANTNIGCIVNENTGEKRCKCDTDLCNAEKMGRGET